MKKFIPLIIIVALMVAAYFLGLGDYLTYENLKTNREQLIALTQRHPISSPIIFVLIYLIATAISLPGGALLSLIAGFLFKVPMGTIYVLIGATLGAICIFIAAKTALQDVLKRKAGPFLNKMEAGFNQNASSYMLFLRFIPIFPFWLVNLAPAFFNVSLITYAWTTFVGIIPGSYVFTQAGAGLGAIFDSGESFSIDTIFNNQMKIALIALALFSLIPIVIKRFVRK